MSLELDPVPQRYTPYSQVLKHFQNTQIFHDIQEKWFSVYHYIQLHELFFSVQGEYMKIMRNMYLPLSILFFLLCAGIGWIMVAIILWVYAGIFLKLLIVLVQKTSFFLKYRYVIYTKDAIFLHTSTLQPHNTDQALALIGKLESMFGERLWHASYVHEFSKQEFAKLKTRITDAFINNSENGALLTLVTTVLFVISFFVGYIIGFFFFLVAYICVWVLMVFSINTQVRIKRKVFALDRSLGQIKATGNEFRSAVHGFLSKENINISGAVERYLPIFYAHIKKANSQNNTLYRTLRNTDFHELLDFDRLDKYIHSQFNTPIQSMIELMGKMHKRIETQLQEVQRVLDTTHEENLRSNIKLKLTTLEHQNHLILSHIAQLKKTLL